MVFGDIAMSKSSLVTRSANVSGSKPEVSLLTPTEQKMLLEFMLYTMQFEQRNLLMINHPRLYNVLFPGTLKIHVSTTGTENCESRVVCEE